MNDVVESGLKGISAFELVGWIMFGCFIIAGIVAATIKIYKVVEKYRKIRNKQEEYAKKITENESAIEELKKTDKQIEKTLVELCSKVDALGTQLISMQTESDLQRRNTLKDRIRQSYAIYHEKQEITAMEKEALQGLIEAYESAGGKNSFVHSIVEKEMYSWSVLP